MTKAIENIEKFDSKTVKSWKKKDFVKHFEGRFPNAEEIYDSLTAKKKKETEG